MSFAASIKYINSEDCKERRDNLTSDPNRLDDEQYIVRLIAQVITVSLETMKVVNGLPLEPV